ncbi:MAG: nucleoside phosphorylase, partial [Parasporobacterium sp.]|nr:nucleoside phosphorylase [Parasporobacterium sp.]
YLDDFVTAAQHVVDGKPDLVSRDDLQGFQMGFFKDIVRVQVGNSCINYLPEGADPEKPGRKQATLHGSEYPVLEFDENKTAKLNPSAFVDTPFPFDKMVITFFPEVIDKLLDEEKIVEERVIGGENPITVYQFLDSDVLLTLGQVGCPACGGNLDLFHAMGIRRVMFCGGGGVLDKNIEVGQLLLVDGAVRDEGFSYQYIEPSRFIFTEASVTDKIAAYLDKNAVSYLRGLTWTTDALFRETPERIEKRKAEGAKIVEMEQAGCIAVARARGFSYGALIYGGDDVSQEEWSNRGWRSRNGVRYDLVELCRRLTEEL